MTLNTIKAKPRTILLLCCVLFIANWILYANTLPNKFAFDDKSLIVENKFVNESYTLKEVFTTSYRSGVGYTGDALYRPLVILSFILNKGETVHPRPFHFVNITLNALNGLLVFLLFIFLTGNGAVSLISALIFSFHPIHTEAVANIAGRPELLCSLFMFISWLLFEKSGKHLLLSIPAALFFLAALLSKETAVVLPIMVITVDIVRKRPLKEKKIYAKYILLVLTVIIYMIIRLSVLHGTSGLQTDFVDNPIAASPAMERIATSFGVFLRYVLLLVAPVRLSSDYSYNQLPVYTSILNIIPLFALILLLCSIAFTIYFRRQNHLYLIGLIIFLFPYLLVSNILFPVGTIMGERLMYIPSAGFSLVLGTFIYSTAGKWRYPVLIVFVVLLSAYCLKTFTRNRDWFDDFSLFSADLKNSPGSVKVLCNMGFLSGKNGNHRTGENYYRKALEIFPDYDVALRGLGKKLYDQRRYEESARYYAKAAETSPNKAELRYDYATVLEKLGRFDQAEKELLIAIKLDPSAPKSYEELGTVKIAQEHYEDAIRYLRIAMEKGGNKRLIFNNLAAAHFFLGDYEEAYKFVREAEKIGIRLIPEMVNAIKSKVDRR